MEDEEKRDDEQIVEDTDADTRDVTGEVADDYGELSKRMTKMEAAIERMTGVVSAVQKAQTSMVDMGAVIRETPANVSAQSDEEDSFVPLEEMDFSVK